jgi:hypothetical protein
MEAHRKPRAAAGHANFGAGHGMPCPYDVPVLRQRLRYGAQARLCQVPGHKIACATKATAGSAADAE